jgi:RsiW-degrading membrane proteinase PrsW (M82 family)
MSITLSFLLIFLSFLPPLVWLNFFLREDLHPEPKRKLFISFFLGFFAAAGISLLFQIFFAKLGSLLISNFTIEDPPIFFIFLNAAIEEFFKFLVVYLMLQKSRVFDEPIDTMVYMITAALGFAMIENFFILSGTDNWFIRTGGLMFRFVGANLLHALCSALIGYYWAQSLVRLQDNRLAIGPRKFLVVRGIVIASLLHGLFNYFIIKNITLVVSLVFVTLFTFFILWDFEKVKVENI